MACETEKGMRKPRADVLRNRERLLAAAADVFRSGGSAASLEAVARAAGVGIGTLYRHFPTREALIEIVYRREVEALAVAARVGAQPPGRSFGRPLCRPCGARRVALRLGHFALALAHTRIIANRT